MSTSRVKNIGFIRNISHISAITMTSRLFGFARDLLLAGLFGNSVAADAFVFAYRFPAMLRTLLIEEGFQAAFIPIYVLLKNKPQAQRQFTGAVLLVMAGVSLAVLLPAVVFMPQIMSLLAKNFRQYGEAFDLLILLARILFCYFLFLSISAVFVNLLQAQRRFIAASLLPMMLSMMLITVMLVIWFFPETARLPFGEDVIVSLAVTVIFAGIIQVAFITAAAFRAGLVPILSLAQPVRPLVRRFFRKMLPVIFAKSTVQFNFLINQILILGTSSGALATFYYAERMMHLPVGIFIIAITTVLLPDLSHHLHNDDSQARRTAETRAVTGVFLLTLPAMIAFGLLAVPMMLTLFQRGAFGVEAALSSAFVLSLLGLGLPAIGMVKIQTTILFAHHDTKTPFIIAVLGAALNIMLVLILIRLMSYPGAALASSLALIAQSLLFAKILKKRELYRMSMTLWRNLGKIILACVLMAVVLWGLTPAEAWWVNAVFASRFFALAALILAGGLAYIGSIIALKLITWQDLQRYTGQVS